MTIVESAHLYITLGATFLIGLGANALGARTKLPRVTLLLILGFLIGPIFTRLALIRTDDGKKV